MVIRCHLLHFAVITHHQMVVHEIATLSLIVIYVAMLRVINSALLIVIRLLIGVFF